jgi:hypothetical protein
MDKAMAYSVLVAWLECKENRDREKWCHDKMLSLLLRDERETISFLKAQQDHQYLDLLAELLPELAYQFNSRIFLRQLENIQEYHDSEIWRQNLEKAKSKVKAPDMREMEF